MLKTSLSLIIKTYLIIIFIVISANALHAETTPKQQLTEIISSLQQKRSPSALIPYVHWETAYQQFAVEQREALNVNSANELKAFYSELLNDPAGMLRKTIVAQYPKMSADRKAYMEKNIDEIIANAEKRRLESETKIAEAKFEIGDEKISGDSALVTLRAQYLEDGKQITKQDDITFQKINGVWMLPSLYLLNQQATSDSAANAN